MTAPDPIAGLRIGHRFAGVLLLSVCAGIGGAQLVTTLTPKTYQAQASVLVAGGGGLAMPTVARLAESREVALASAARAGLPPALVTGHISADSQPGVQIVTLTATAGQAARAAMIADAAAHALSAEVAAQPIDAADPVTARTVGTATPPSGPVTPMPMLNDSLGALLGTLVGLVSLRRRFGDRLCWTDQIEARLALPILAVFPGMSRRSIQRGARAAYARGRIAREAGEAAAVITLLAQTSGYRRLLTTSVRDGEETMAAALLALGLADCNDHVTLVDAQLRRSTLAHHFPEAGEHSLQSVLTGSPALPPKENASAALTVLPAAGDGGQDGSSLLRGQPFAELMAAAVEGSDLVLVQGPAILQNVDVAALAIHTDASVLVVRAGATRLSEAKRAASLLRRLGSPVVGVVVIGAVGTRRSTLGWPSGPPDASVSGISRTAPSPRTGAEPDSAGAPPAHELRRIAG